MLAQIIGLLAALAGFWAMSRSDAGAVKRVLLIHTALYGIHFLILGLPLAVWSNLVAFARIGISMRSCSWLWVILFCSISLLSIIPNPPSCSAELLPTIASLVLTITLFRLKGTAFRLGLLFGSALWLLHNVWAGSWGGIILEIGMILSNVMGWKK